MSVKCFYNLRLCQFLFKKEGSLKLYLKQTKIRFLCPSYAKLRREAVDLEM